MSGYFMNPLAMAWQAWLPVGTPAERLIANALAMRADERGWSSPTTKWLAEWSRLDRDTVKAALVRLARAGFITDTEERTGKTGRVIVWRLAVEMVPDEVAAFLGIPNGGNRPPLERDNGGNRPPLEPGNGGNRPPLEPGNGGTDRALERGNGGTDRALVHEKPPLLARARDQEIKLSSVEDGERGPGKTKPERTVARRLPSDWTAPAIADLAPAIRDFVETWPEGRYRRAEEAFVDWWTQADGPKARKRDWLAAWRGWLRREDDSIPAGVRVRRPAAPSADGTAENEIEAVPGEPDIAAELRRRFAADRGAPTYREWLAKLRIVAEGDGLTVLAPSSFVRDYVRDNLGGALGTIAQAIAGRAVSIDYRLNH